jgi:hypothetical protein
MTNLERLWYLTRAVGWFYRRKQHYERLSLEEQRKRQKETVHELKTKTKFTRVKNLLETYGDERPSAAGLVQRPIAIAQQPIPRPLQQNQPQQQNQQQNQSQQHNQPQQQNQPKQQNQENQSQKEGLQKQWYDKLFDAIIGPVESANNKYALICTRCFTHNGLVLPEAYATTRTIC